VGDSTGIESSDAKRAPGMRELLSCILRDNQLAWKHAIRCDRRFAHPQISATHVAPLARGDLHGLGMITIEESHVADWWTGKAFKSLGRNWNRSSGLALTSFRVRVFNVSYSHPFQDSPLPSFS
jgi:hypothetical protein